jgi:hypothetical protein
MTPSEMAHARRGREKTPAQNNNKIKSKQLKLRKTYPTKWLNTTDS